MKRLFVPPLVSVFCFLVAVAVSTQTYGSDFGKGAMVLLTMEEAARPDIPAEGLLPQNTVCASGKCIVVPNAFSLVETKHTTGPRISVLEPSPIDEHRPPIRLAIDFLPREGTQVDLESFKLECLKLIPINITDRVIQYVKPQGIRIEKADLPPGEHKLRITLKDTKDGITQQVYLLKIAK